ncbi:Nn.00g096380.m01.CDS01 [Neocucurbitaria sp. VM-36]
MAANPATSHTIDPQCTILTTGEACLGFGVSCNSDLVQARGTDLCAICKKIDILKLKDLYGTTDEGLDAVNRIRDERDWKVETALARGLLVCALENPRWDYYPWRYDYNPISTEPCVFLDAPGADEGRFCQNCSINEKISERKLPYVVPESEKYPYARVKFTCVWRDELLRDENLRKYHSRPWACGDEHLVKYPASMCEHCQAQLAYAPNLYMNTRDYFWSDGRYKACHTQEFVPVVKGEVPASQRPDVHISVLGETGADIYHIF